MTFSVRATSVRFDVSNRGLHWEALDEDISVAGLLAGFRDQTRPPSSAAE
jgi:hypothetical protein